MTIDQFWQQIAPALPGIITAILLGAVTWWQSSTDKKKTESRQTELFTKWSEGFKADLEKANSEVRNLQRENQRLEVKFAEIKGARDADKEHFKERLSEEKNAREGELLRVGRALAETKELLDTVSKADAEKNTRIAELTQQLADVETRLTALQTELANEREKAQTLETTREQLVAKTTEQAAKITDLETEVTTLKAQVDALKQENRDKDSVIAELQSKVNGLMAA